MNGLDLLCNRCGHRSEASKVVWRCPRCSGPLEWLDRPAFDPAKIDRDATGLWRYRAFLPLRPGVRVSLGEITTPLVEVELEDTTLTCKLEFLSPTGSFKDRGAAVLISALRALGAEHAVEDSSGNAAAAMAAYAARAGMRCTVFAPAAASAAKLVQTSLTGAEVVRIEGSRDDVAEAAIRAAATLPAATYASHNWHPFFIEGVKTWAFELWEQLGRARPDAVIAPTGSGSILLGASLAFAALREAGAIDALPRLYAAQPAACAPVHAALRDGLDAPMPFERRPTMAEGASIANPVRGHELVAAIRQSGGGTVALEEVAIAEGVRWAARQGITIEPTAALALAAARRLIRSGELRSGGRIVAVLTGSGLKATEALQRL